VLASTSIFRRHFNFFRLTHNESGFCAWYPFPRGLLRSNERLLAKPQIDFASTFIDVLSSGVNGGSLKAASNSTTSDGEPGEQRTPWMAGWDRANR
jgi:hypothetical protein